MANAKVDVVGQDDIPVVVELYNRIYRPTHDVQFFRRRFLGRYNVLMLVATLDETPVGFFIGFELKPTVFFAWLYGVMPEVRRQGIASQLMDAAHAWATLRDSRNITRVFAGVLIDVKVDGDLRDVTFANGNVVQERIVAVGDARMRVAYTVCGPNFEHYAASMQIVADETGERCRLVWTCDFLPDERRALVEPLMDAGSAAAARNLAT